MLSGEGAALHGGRWNSPGSRIVYLSETLSLAAFELLVHVPNEVLAPYKYLRISVPEDMVVALDEGALPVDWKRPNNPELAAIGDEWIDSDVSLGLSLPSVLIPGERNVILRPEHPDFENIQVGTIHDFRYDPRLAKQK
jgi:RES domain-containing protein